MDQRNAREAVVSGWTGQVLPSLAGLVVIPAL